MPSRYGVYDRSMNTVKVSSFLTLRLRGSLVVDVVARRRKRRVLARVTRAAWRLEQAERERAWALAAARTEGASIREIATAAGLSSSRVHQVVTDADIDALDAVLGVLRSAGGPR
jgi:hypothetical protein